MKANPDISNFTNYGLLDPIPRIIQKGDIKIFDVDKINTNSKSKNQIALKSFRNEIRREYLKNFFPFFLPPNIFVSCYRATSIHD